MRRLKTGRRPPIYPKTPGHLPCSSLTHPLPLSSRRPSVSFGGFGLRPPEGWAGDFIPFYWRGEYHLFYLKTHHDGEGVPWFHVGTRDFVEFADYGEALPRGGREAQDQSVFTGCVIEKEGLFHIFYTGNNPYFREDGKPQQAVMHATSLDLMEWSKHPSHTFSALDSRYGLHDWRDPFVFWNDEADEYWMLLAARLKDGPDSRRGCLALCASRDLVEWEVREPFWSPGLYYTHECPDLFRMGDWWYLVYSTFSDRHVTHYRMSRSLSGPWTAPDNDTFDGRTFYAAKTASDGNRRFAFGWNPTREGETDDGAWQWGGSLVVHEIRQRTDGALTVKVPHEVESLFATRLPLLPEPQMGTWRIAPSSIECAAVDGFAWCRLDKMPDRCLFRTTVAWDRGTRGCGLLLRADGSLNRYYQVRLEPDRGRVVFDRAPRAGDQPFVMERPVDLASGTSELKVFLEDTIIEVYVNDTVALSMRGYDHRKGFGGLFVSEGKASFTGTEMRVF